MTPPRTTRILLADDHLPVRVGLKLALDSEPDLEVVAEAEDGAEALRRALAEDIDLAVLDVTMPRLTGIQVARELAKRKPAVRSLILSMHDSERYLFQALRAGAVGYVLKSGADRDLVAACRATMHGEPWLYTGAIEALIRDHVETAGKSQKLTDDPLSPRESRVLKLLAESYTRGEIARMLMISESTVDRDRVNIFAKLRIRDRTELTRYAIRRGLVEP